MKREEKNQQMKRRIMESALAEFSAQGYGASSINSICAVQDISKGIVYHYFETKDALFLACIEECFQKLTGYIRENRVAQEDTQSSLQDYFAIRTRFFSLYPVYQRIFCEAVISPPAHLREEIQTYKKDFDDLNIQILKELLSSLPLSSDISKEEVIEFFRLFQDFINIRYEAAGITDEGFAAHEERCRKALHILLYGVIRAD